MNDLISVVGLEDMRDSAGVRWRDSNFEVVYEEVSLQPSMKVITTGIEENVHAFFSGLELPDTPTVHDYLVLSLRKKCD